MDKFTIGRLAKAADVGVETVRFYQRRGLLSEPPRGLGSVRRYGPEDVARLRFIRTAQELGFSLSEVHELLSLEDGGTCRAVQALAQAKLDVIRERIEGLKRVQGALTSLLGQCASRKGKVKCPIISTLQHLRVSSP